MRLFISIVLIFLASGCTSNLSSKLGTLKNPHPVLSRPGGMAEKEFVNPFVAANYNVLLEATIATKNNRTLAEVGKDNMARYLTAGFALSDFYCEQFFADADESQRRRRFGRGVTNDVGTAIAAVLGLANAGQNVVTGAATSFGLADSLWRNYDDAFLVTPDLSNVKTLVYAAQDNFRQKTFSAELPKQYGSAQSVIMRYAHTCSTLGMKALLSQAANQQKAELEAETKEVKDGNSNPSASPQAAMQAVPSEPSEATATPD